jgi:hypothetical protein
MNLYDATVPVFTKFLGGIEKWLDKAVAYADQKKFDPETLMQARLAPDQYPFLRQVQSACDQAKYCVAKLTGKEPPSHPDTEKTIAEIRARVRTVLDYLKTFKPEDFKGAEDRLVKHSWMPASLKGGELPLPPDDRVRDPSPQRRRRQQDGLHGLAAVPEELSQSPASECASRRYSANHSSFG